MIEAVKEEDFLRPLVEQIVQQILEAEMGVLGAERASARPAGTVTGVVIYPRTLVTRVGKFGVAGTAGPAGEVPDGGIRAVSAEREGAGGGTGGECEELEKFAHRRLEEAYPYLVLDARYEKVREDGAIRSQAVRLAIGINREGRRCVLAVELASRESTTVVS